MAIDHDLSSLPFHVDMLVVPSNEWLEDPGFGALHAVTQRAGPGLQRWLTDNLPRLSHELTNDQPPLCSGEALVSPAFGLDADWLCHGVGINWHRAGAKAICAQVRLIQRTFLHAAQVGATSIAIPAISTGARCFPTELAALITLAVARAEVTPTLKLTLKLTLTLTLTLTLKL